MPKPDIPQIRHDSGAVILLSLRTGHCLLLNPLAAAIWSRLAAGKSLEETYEECATHYQISSEKVASLFEPVLRQLASRHYRFWSLAKNRRSKWLYRCYPTHQSNLARTQPKSPVQSVQE
jgi:hypothetical protein